MTIQRLDHVSVVVDDLEAAKAFFVELGMELEGEAPIEGAWVGGGSAAQHGAGSVASVTRILAGASSTASSMEPAGVQRVS